MNKRWFIKKPSLRIRLVIGLIICTLLMVFDNGHSSSLLSVRNIMEKPTGIIYYISSLPRSFIGTIADHFSSQHRLILENQALQKMLKEKNADLLLMEQLKAENQRFRLLLKSNLHEDAYKKIAQVINLEITPNHQQISVNKGSKDGAFIGQSVINQQGAVGQIISVGEISSRVLLISDTRSAIPVQILRNGNRFIVSGIGKVDELSLDEVPNSTDIKAGDILVTSGLDGRFPAGYPLAKVTKVEINKQSYFATVTAVPVATLTNLQDVLLIWKSDSPSGTVLGVSDND